MGLWTVSVVREKHHEGDTVKQIVLSKKMMCCFLCQYKRGIIKRQLPIYLLTYTDSAVLNMFYCIQEISQIIIFPLKELNKFAVTDNKQILFVTEYEFMFEKRCSHGNTARTCLL